MLVLMMGAAEVVPERMTAQDTRLAANASSFASDRSHTQVAFDDLFTHRRSITVEGTDEHPINRLTSLATYDTLVAIVDQSRHTLTLLGESGEILFQVGREGGGGGEFTNPDWVGFDALGRIVVKEWHSNHRVQIFSAEDGNAEAMFSLEHASVPTGLAFIDGSPEDQRIIFPTSVGCSDDDEAFCVVQEQAFSGEVLRRFGPMHEIEPDYEGQPFVMGRDSEGRSFLAHRFGSRVSVYDAEGALIDRFDIADAGQVQPLPLEELPDEEDHRVAEREEEITMIRSIQAVQNHVIVMHYRDYAEPHHFLTVFDRAGNVLASGVDVDYPLQHISDDRFFFVEENFEGEQPRYVIHEYQYNPPPVE